MSEAMMLPTAFPLLEIFRRLSIRQPNRIILMILLIVGYLTIWGIFGLVAHIADYGLHKIVKRSPWLTFNGWVIGAAVIGLAGLFQFSALKYRCLDKCRTPMSFVLEHWRAKSEKWQAFLLGIHHGIFCIGCCWALMLLSFVIGTGSVGWMFLLGAVMAAEKNSLGPTIKHPAWGRPNSLVRHYYCKCIRFPIGLTPPNAQKIPGSGFTRLVVELADFPGHTARAITRRHKTATEESLCERLERTGLRHSQDRAREIILLIKGSTVLMLIHGDRKYIEAASQATKLLLIHEYDPERVTFGSKRDLGGISATSLLYLRKRACAVH